ncbi:MAG: hypothetical protein MMC23_004017 [Stictis urceolatum]|nr:hypothetical protein [Stictis urceolata]
MNNTSGKSGRCTRSTVSLIFPRLLAYAVETVGGPVVRISPDELHVDEPEFIDVLYPAGGVVRVQQMYVTPISSQYLLTEFCKSAFGTTDHYLHRSRRAPMNNFFSKGPVSAPEPRIYECVEKVCNHLENYHAGSGTPA